MNLTNLKIAFRNILKSKTESVINILGLGIGLGSIMLLVVLVIHEFSFDRFIPNHKTAFRIIQGDDCRTPFPLAEEIENDIPEVQSYFRFYQTNNLYVKDKNNQVLSENWFAFSDPAIFNNLDTKFKYGIPAQTINEVAISETIAKKYFNNENASGKVLPVKFKDEFIDLTVSGVYKDFPINSTLHPEFIAHLELSGEVFGQTRQMLGTYGAYMEEYKSWQKRYFYTYVFLKEQSDAKIVEKKIQVYTKMLDEENREGVEYKLQPVSDIYYNSNEYAGNFYGRFGSANELKYYVAIAMVLLIIAIINYIFLTRAKILKRLKELGVKKALGATQNTIRKQVMFEANLISLLSLLPAFFIIIPGMPFVNNVLNKSLNNEVFSLWQTWVALLLIVLLAGTLSGLIIGNNISKTSTITLLVGTLAKQRKKFNLRNSFLSIHFAIFIILVASVFSFQKQIRYSLTNFKAINPENILVCELNTPELKNQFSVIKNELEKNPGVIKVAGSSFVPPFNYFLPITLATEAEKVRFDGLILGEGMVELLEMEILDGEPFREFEEGQRNIIVNESAANKYNIKAGELLNGFLVNGIVKDFSAHSMHSLIQPMAILQQHPKQMRLLAVKTKGINDEAIIKEINQLCKEISPESFVSVNHLTDNINQFYTREQNQAKLIGMFSLLAIVLSVMGLLGIVLITISDRTKEIGIRKVNGAKVTEILSMINKDFIKWVVIGFIVACPASYYAMQKWLENFAYKTTLSWWIFALAGILALGIALLTVSWQSLRAATRNPVEALRYE